MLTNSSDPDSYPISGFTWLILYKEQSYDGRSLEQAKATLDLLNWIIGDEAQSQAATVQYAPLPADAVAKAKVILESVTYKGEPVQ